MEEEMQISSPSARRLIATILFAFLITFVIARLFVYLVLGHWMPDMFLTIKGVHIHHFTYGVVILGAVGLYMILKRPVPETKKFFFATVLYGVGLGLTFDEFGMWVRLEDGYWVRQSYDAVITVALLLFNIAYFKSLASVFRKHVIHRVHRIVKYEKHD